MPPDWYVTKDGDLSCLELYERHYSCYDYKHAYPVDTHTYPC